MITRRDLTFCSGSLVNLGLLGQSPLDPNPSPIFHARQARRCRHLIKTVVLWAQAEISGSLRRDGDKDPPARWSKNDESVDRR